MLPCPANFCIIYLFLVIFVFLVEMGFHHLGQAVLELLTSGDLSTSAFQSARIKGVSHCAQPILIIGVPKFFFSGFLFIILQVRGTCAEC